MGSPGARKVEARRAMEQDIPSIAPTPSAELSRTVVRRAMFAILLIAVLVRIPGLLADLPFSYYGDETHLIKRSLAIASGELNPHWFHKPAFLMYILAFAYGVMYLVGRVFGAFESPHHFAAIFFDDPGTFILIGRCVVCACGVGMVYVIGRLARRIFQSDRAALASALLAAVLVPLVVASTRVKADVPAALLTVLSLDLFLAARSSGRTREFVWSALVGGFAIGMKFYGVILIPVFVIVDWMDGRALGRHWAVTTRRTLWIPALFLLGFFVVSPYHFIDSTFVGQITGKVSSSVAVSETVQTFDPDSGVRYQRGLVAVPGALLHFGERFVSGGAFGIAATLLFVLGLVVALGTRASRGRILIPMAAVVVFVGISVTFGAYHTNPRHLVAIAPFLCLLAAPGLASTYPRGIRIATGVLLVLALGASVTRDIGWGRKVLREDSRNVARAWVIGHIPSGSPILLDDYGPVLSPDPESVSRIRRRLAQLPAGEAFTAHQAMRLRILAEYPSPNARTVQRLGHPWWMDREPIGDELAKTWEHRDMGNPIVDRVPLSLAEYRREGIRYIVTNAEAQRRYYETEDAPERFPRWRQFYDGLRTMEPEHRIDPAEFGGKGPVVTIYRLDAR